MPFSLFQPIPFYAYLEMSPMEFSRTPIKMCRGSEVSTVTAGSVYVAPRLVICCPPPDDMPLFIPLSLCLPLFQSRLWKEQWRQVCRHRCTTLPLKKNFSRPHGRSIPILLPSSQQYTQMCRHRKVRPL